MPVIQPIVDLAALCVEHGITCAVISPGSRSAAVTLAFARNHYIRTIVVMDERAAGFIAMGIAQQLRTPVALVCTSGTAAYNFAPAIAEAFFQEIPLLVLTADRPPEWIHQHDGQTIYQQELYGKHVKRSFAFPADTAHPDQVWHANRVANEAILLAAAAPPGPVHINIPIREPFYPSEGERFAPSVLNRKIERIPSEKILPAAEWHRLQEEWEDSERILIAVGQQRYDPALALPLQQLTEEWEIPVLADITSNLPEHPERISRHDLFLKPAGSAALRPELLVTCGGPFLSKSFKKFIRDCAPEQHWHIGGGEHLIDTFQSLTRHIPVTPAYFFSKLLEDIDYRRFLGNDQESGDPSYKENWLRNERAARRETANALRNLTSLNDLTLLDCLISALPDGAQLHLGNSMPVRYANMLGCYGKRHEVFANRGTSGIDGCVSTAVGAALVTELPVYLVVGDVSFLYDRNGLLLEELPRNLKIAVVNNGGGNIFRMIDGPSRQPELERYFETRHAFSAEKTAADSGIAYFSTEVTETLQDTVLRFVQYEGIAIFEAFTDPELNRAALRRLSGLFEHTGPQ